MRISILAAVAVLPVMPSVSSAECLVQRFTFVPNGEAQTTMSVSSGRTCGIVVVSSSGRSRYDQVRIIERPKHGALSPRTGVGVTYKSVSGYKGEDSFVYSITGEMKTGYGTATIKVRVSVI